MDARLADRRDSDDAAERERRWVYSIASLTADWQRDVISAAAELQLDADEVQIAILGAEPDEAELDYYRAQVRERAKVVDEFEVTRLAWALVTFHRLQQAGDPDSKRTSHERWLAFLVGRQVARRQERPQVTFRPHLSPIELLLQVDYTQPRCQARPAARRRERVARRRTRTHRCRSPGRSADDDVDPPRSGADAP